MAFPWAQVIGVGLEIFKGVNEKKSRDSQADVAGANQAAMQKEAEYQQWRTSVLLKRQAEYTQKLIGAQRVAYAKAGIQIDVGTANRLAEETLRQSAEDTELIRKEGQFNYERALAGVNMWGRQQEDISRQGYIEAGTSILTGGVKFAESMNWI